VHGGGETWGLLVRGIAACGAAQGLLARLGGMGAGQAQALGQPGKA
jgi:hypothetical protein